jgi:hypothetical protein
MLSSRQRSIHCSVLLVSRTSSTVRASDHPLHPALRRFSLRLPLRPLRAAHQPPWLDGEADDCGVTEGRRASLSSVGGSQLMPNVPLDVMRVVLTHLDAAISGDGGIQAIDVMDALRWWESADALALQGAPAVA